MVRFILLSFFFLGWAFYEVSGGTEFTEQLDAQRAKEIAEQNRRIAQQEQKKPVTTASVVPAVTEAMVTRAAYDPVSVNGNANPAKNPTPRSEKREDTATDTTDSLNDPQPEQTMPAQTIEETAPEDIRKVAGSRVNMRMGPSTSYNVILRLTRGTRVKVLQEPGNGWVKLKVEESGRVGWMASRLLTKVPG